MTSIIVAFPKAEDAKNIRNIIVRNGYQVSAVCVSGAQVLQAADNLGEGMVVCSYRFRDMQYDHLKECLPRDFEMLLVASEGILDTCVDQDIVRLCLPLKVHDLMDTIEFMQAAIIRRQKKKKKMPKVRSEKEQKMIDAAKKLLMDRNSMTEEEAHRYMQKCSMDSGTNLVETAEMVFALMTS